MKKKTLVGILLIVALLLGFSVQTFAGNDSIANDIVLDVKGDVDGNGKITARDALKTLLYAAKLENPATDDDIYRANVNGDSSITVDDAKDILNAYLNDKNFGYKYNGNEKNLIFVSSDSLYWNDENCYTSLADAVKFLNANPPKSEAERITVCFAPGVYREHTELKAPFVTYRAMFPESEEDVNLTYYYGCGVAYNSLGGVNSSASTSEASTIINAVAHDFIAENIRFENSYNLYVTDEELDDYCGYPSNNYPITIRQDDSQIRVSKYQTQALALLVMADRCQFINCDIVSRQDTLLMNAKGNRSYFENCFIEGTVDFIYGNGTAVFESCTINIPYHGGHVTAGSHDMSIKYGFLFKDCSLTRIQTTPDDAPDDNSSSLGRNWHNQPMVCYWNCKMDEHIYKGLNAVEDVDLDGKPYLKIIEGRWRPMGSGDTVTRENSRFSEVGTMDINGNPIELNSDVIPDFEDVLQQSDMQPGGEYAAYKWLYGTDKWNPGNYPTE